MARSLPFLGRLVVFALASTLASCGSGSDDRFVGRAPPSLETPTGTWLNADAPPAWKSLLGNVVYLEFGFLRCPYCAAMAPRLEEWDRELSEKGLRVIQVEHGPSTPLDALQTHVQSDGIRGPYLYDDDGSVTERFGVRAFPTAFVIDRSGKVAWHGFPTRSVAAVKAALDAALAK